MEKILIRLENQQKAMRLNLAALKALIRKILRLEGIAKAQIAFVFVNRSTIQSLNKSFLKRSYATDVLAFDLRDKKNDPLFADIVISTDAVLKQAKKFKTTPAEELVLYLIHGILHLNGFDDHSPEDVAAMRKEEAIILSKIKKSVENIVAS